MKHFKYILMAFVMLSACQPKNNDSILSDATIENAFEAVVVQQPDADTTLLRRGIKQSAALWRAEDGTSEEFVQFVAENFAPNPEAKLQLFERLERIFELIQQNADMLQVELTQPVIQTNCGEPLPIDWILTAYSPLDHMSDDMFQNKIAFICTLNFPHFTLEEKEAAQWNRQEWGYARMGDWFTERIASSVKAQQTKAMADAENYISEYNIMMGSVRTDDGRQLWPEGMALLSHWNLRDELKSNYANVPDAREKQEMIYQIMLRIIRQEIPAIVINNPAYTWAPISNQVWKEGDAISAKSEPDTRYQQVIDIFHAMQAEDAVRPDAPSHVLRCFDEQLEMSYEEIESLFTTLLSSPQVGEVAKLIQQRLGRELRPYDIWYDGFKSRSTISEDELTAQTRRMYPSAEAYHQDMPRMLMNMGFTAETANFLYDHIMVDPARGSGHAHPCVGRAEPARLRTRVGNDGMDYKGYNIAVHEMGHNVEEVLSLYRMDHYTLAGIPNTGFTEASAFLFQQRDLQLLGYGPQTMDAMTTLDIFWGLYEIMGVSLLDMHMWQWLYEHPSANASQLREAVCQMAGEIWNQYYAPYLGEENCPLLAIYSHMIGYALYLPGYPIGHLVQFQLEEHLAKCADNQAFAKEYERIYRQGRLTPNAWMQGAVGANLSVEPILRAVERIMAVEQ